MKLEADSFTVNLPALEHFLMSVTHKNVENKADEAIIILNKVQKSILDKSSNKDPDKSVELEYGAKVRIMLFTFFNYYNFEVFLCQFLNDI